MHTPVLIVGGSLVGLSASLFLSWRGVPHTVVERHTGSSHHPRAMGFTATTLEHFHRVGLAGQIPQTPAGTRLRRVVAHSLAGQWQEDLEWTPGQAQQPDPALSPCTGAAVAQDRLEPLLRQAALERGATLRLGTEWLELRQQDDGAVARLRTLADGREHEITADYVIAADGADSGLRQSLGMGRSGVGLLRVLRSVLFHCPGADAFLARGAQQFAIRQPGLSAFLTTYGDSRWVLMFEDDAARSTECLRAAVAQALGAPLDFDILATGRWDMAGRVADRYRCGRVFLVGDAAHQLPPTRGGFGANTGIDDAWNLAWKLERVLKGSSRPGLLDTYESERRPIAWLRHQQTFSRPDYAPWAGPDFVPDPLFGNEAMEFGQLLRSAAVIGAGPDLPAAAEVSRWAGQPGTRAPHAWVRCQGRTLSTQDLLGRDFVLLTADPAWRQAGQALGLQTLTVGQDLVFPADQPFERLFGVETGGASLVRPDAIVGWRSPGPLAPQPAQAALARALDQITQGRCSGPD